MKKSPQHQITKSGKEIKDTKDCTVRATSNFMNWDYAKAHEEVTETGRIKNKGFNLDKIADHLQKKHKVKLVKYSLNVPVTLEKFIELIPEKGSFLISSRRHAFCIKNKVVHDHLINRSSTFVFGYWVFAEDKYKPHDLIGSKRHESRRPLRTQRDVVAYLMTKKMDIHAIAEYTGIQLTNIVHFCSKIKAELEK